MEAPAHSKHFEKCQKRAGGKAGRKGLQVMCLVCRNLCLKCVLSTHCILPLGSTTAGAGSGQRELCAHAMVKSKGLGVEVGVLGQPGYCWAEGSTGRDRTGSGVPAPHRQRLSTVATVDSPACQTPQLRHREPRAAGPWARRAGRGLCAQAGSDLRAHGAAPWLPVFMVSHSMWSATWPLAGRGYF